MSLAGLTPRAKGNSKFYIMIKKRFKAADNATLCWFPLQTILNNLELRVRQNLAQFTTRMNLQDRYNIRNSQEN